MRYLVTLSTLLVLVSSGCSLHHKSLPCTVNIDGAWSYSYIYFPDTLTRKETTFEQTGCTFSGVDPSYTIIGTIVGNEIHLVQMVTGETQEGWLMRVEGHYYEGTTGKGKITGMYSTSDGKTGAWYANEILP